MKLWKKFVTKCYVIKLMIYSYFICPFLFDKNYKKVSDTNIKSMKETADELVNTNKSMARYGDGEFSWMLGKNCGVNTFEKSSKKLAERLAEVFNSDRDDFIITLPDAMKDVYDKKFTKESLIFWHYFFTKMSKSLAKIVNKNKVYYNTNVVRPYMDYNCNAYAKENFSILKQVWKNKKILIVEGSQSRLGYNDDLFDNCADIKRIECPVTNAFEKYDLIFKKVQEFLDENPDYLTLISLGPTATILSYDLCKKGHRALDIGHIDVEYEWYLIGAKDKISLSDKYVNEVQGSKTPDQLIDHSHDDEIVCKI